MRGKFWQCIVILAGVFGSFCETQAQDEAWVSQGVGSLNPAGSSSYSSTSDQFTVTASGADIWGTIDAFQFVHRPLAGNGSLIAQVASVQSIDPWTKAGIMLRESTAANARHVALFVTPGNGVSFQRRLTTGGSTVMTTVGGLAAPVWLKLELKGDTYYASYSTNGVVWTLVGNDVLSMSGTLRGGLAVTSHKNGTAATAIFGNVSLTEASPKAAPAPWLDGDIGNPANVGQSFYENGTYTLYGAGSDIFGSADQFHFLFQPLSGDGRITARLVSQSDTNAWAKSGLMFRSSLDAGAAESLLALTPGNGLTWQNRFETNRGTFINGGVAGVSPRWLGLERLGSMVRAWSSADNSHWTLMGEVVQPMNSQIFAGLAVTSHAAGILNRSVFDQVEVSTQTFHPLPLPWQHLDIGSIINTGTAEYFGGTFSVWGSGLDIYGSSDAFHYTAQPTTGDSILVARVIAEDAPDPWSKAGLMMRASLDANAAYAALFITPGNGLTFQQRLATGQNTDAHITPGLTLPIWLKLERYDPYVVGYYSSDGLTWNYAGHTLLTLPAAHWMGLTVTSHHPRYTCQADFDNVSIATDVGAHGLTGTYYAGSNFNSLAFTRTDAIINFDWGTGSPSPALPNTGFSIRWQGQIQPRFTETYTFSTLSDDGVRLWINGQLVISDWNVHPATQNTGVVPLTANQKYDIKLEYFESNVGGLKSSVQLAWSSAHQPLEIIPTQQLSPLPSPTPTPTPSPTPTATPVPDADGNGLPDAWEQQYFGHLGLDPNALALRGDGLTNLQAYQQGLNPNDFFNGQTPILTIVSGNNQTGAPGGFVSAPLVVSVTDGTGAPVYNAPVTFTVSNGGGAVQKSSSASAGVTITVLTGFDGQARAFFKVPNGANSASTISATAGMGSHATSVAFSENSDDGSGNYRSPFDASDVVATLNADGSLDVSWTNHTDSEDQTPIPVQYMNQDGQWVTLTTVPAGTTSVHLPPQ